MRYLGVDYGKKKMGLSISEGMSASALKTLEVTGLRDALAKIRQVIRLEGVDRVVIGLSESGESRNITQNFIKILEKEIEVITMDETLSSKRALAKMIELGKSRKDRKVDDSTAASFILQDYLDSKAE